MVRGGRGRLAAVLLPLLCVAPASGHVELLVNGGPDADEYSDMAGWTLTASGGDGWAQYADCGGGVPCFRTSYHWCTREQVVALDESEAGRTLDVGEQASGDAFYFLQIRGPRFPRPQSRISS
jgi:hypothetical protein